ncbi:hypothetical protein FMM05_20585 [Flavobacterium zepuense]|uniref:Uncharacterized protein n=1 Tax=Flavobacterium zepuense TaxID=2593302 RepID=A0A552USA1_9FLAO|nr:hypothetical protein [Flavobacterium zepuense]TRW21088.1 hypothetical protein FMM05_20585 [Flavobacterium zepuense]
MNTLPEEKIDTNEVANHYNYPLQGLELLAHRFLEKQGTKKTETNLRLFGKQLRDEIARLQLLLKTQAFALSQEKEIRMLIQRYNSSLTRLLDETLLKKELQNAVPKIADDFYNSYINALEAMIAFLHDYFPEHNSLEQRVPMVSLSKKRKEIVGRLDTIEQKILSHPEEMVAGELFKRLRRFAASGIPITFKIRYRDLRYKDELLRHLNEIRWKNEPEALLTPVEQMLIYLNYNSKAFIKLLIKKITQDIDHLIEPKEKLDTLLLYKKAFRQIRPKPGLVLNPGYHHLGTVLDGWFDEEIRYFEMKLKWSFTTQEDVTTLKKGDKKEEINQLRVLVKLSSDQTGLILRAADELRILVARSLSEVFKTIVPHLSTPHSENLSYKGMRTQSYVAEERDKAIAIEALERIIKKIKEY